MRIEFVIPFWATLIIANVWGAVGDVFMGGIWLIFSIFIFILGVKFK